ncbi:hypothetical protein UFOVP1492_98 [uncultured Caudovirales phage]|uniref:Gp5/Type VI secretion system Vgr protein OB-fold domain-containing protein n=1 Tax=uncultured Caudovirales phage TaxID=2100421 RepID=A0A6J7XKX8_9CAUD|nr:hypothetical protein UFOVP1127_36 [uncultured Caudovirales phage]CAB4193191.1 hypothetical protein UFOVP1242_38 [uncultured Caudovirales phage]CAB4217821.1 hypothetical protein UFOVP1492_98 [uncultured Caudovirales phage]CAB5231639.1 hypothetical protein UFOVP1580_127 [uncultured Caudovirales phage]
MLADLQNILREYGLEYFGRYYSSYRGTVVSNEDPDHLGRLRLKVPQIYGDEQPERWAFAKGMYSGNQHGLYAMPQQGDLVWVSFENGDPRYPIWQYGHPVSKELIPDSERPKPDAVVLLTPAGQKILLDGGGKLVRVEDANGNAVLLSEAGISVISDSIFLGSEEAAAEKAALGETLKAKLESCLDNIAQLTVPTAMGPSGTPINTPAFQQLKATLGEILSGKVKLD